MSLRSLGINVSGRSSRLRINYRSTQEILIWATALMTGEQVDDLDGGSDTLAGYRSELHGGRPVQSSCGTQAVELDALAAKVRDWLEAGVRSTEIVVATRFHEFGNRGQGTVAA